LDDDDSTAEMDKEDMEEQDGEDLDLNDDTE
jgi:hypothetical protein